MICKKCTKEKNDNEFSFKNKELGIKQHTCKSCARDYSKKHYYSNKQYYIDKSRRNFDKYREKVRIFIVNYLLAHPCVDCGESDVVMLDFDHVNGKGMSISQMIVHGMPLKKIKLEILKCEVRCANHHRKRHAVERNFWKTYPL